MSLMFMLNFVPDRATFKVAMNLIIEEFKNDIPEKALSHILERYWNGENPELIGGRAVGRQGMPGSTQGVERAG